MTLDLANQITKALSEWSHEVEEEIEKISEEVASNAVKQLQATSPKNTGAYSKSWTKKKLKNGVYIIYAKGRYSSLTHLLENGHVLANGGRTKARVHIKPVEKEAVSKLEERIRRIGK